MIKSLITFKKPKSPVSEAYRMLRTNLHYLNVDKENRVILVTSPNTGEGKTTTMANLAITLSNKEQRVLLIDCDLRRPNVHKLFEITNKCGLVNLVVEKKPVEDVIQHIEGLPNLDIITSGPIPPYPSELLESSAMVGLMNQFREAYDMILIDAPPVCTVTDAGVLSKLADGVMLVVASNQTNMQSAKLAKKLLENVHANILGVVISKVNISKSDQYYYYYYDESVDHKNKRRKRKKLV